MNDIGWYSIIVILVNFGLTVVICRHFDRRCDALEKLLKQRYNSQR